MVRVFHNIDTKKVSDFIYAIFKLQSYMTFFEGVNHPDVKSCVYAIWHAHQCCAYGLPDRGNVYVMISRSRDGNIIADVTERLGLKVVHGSKGKKGAAEATLQMITELKNGKRGAIMVDGPNGPAKVCKDGIVKIAATKVSAGVSTGIGDHESKYSGTDCEEVGDEQFEIADNRSFDAMYSDMSNNGLQPVLNDYVYV